MANVRLLYIYIYSAPAIISLLIIYHSGYLLGDFRSYSYHLDLYGFFYILLQFLCPLLFIYFFIKLAKKITLIKPRGEEFERFLFVLFVFIFGVTLFFGAVKIGASDNPSGEVGLLTSLVVKLNPYLLLAVLSFSKIKPYRFIFCLITCILFSYKQVSLQGYLVSFFSLASYFLIRVKVNRYIVVVLLALPFLFSSYIFDFLSFLYTQRNQARGFDFDANDIVALSIGRISSLSSYLYIKSHHFNFSGVSEFFSLGMFIERIIGFQTLSSHTPSSIFNYMLLGDADYSIFLGLNGFLYVLFECSPIIFLVNVIFILIAIFFIFQLCPYFNANSRVLTFFLVMYMPILSFDIWELSMLMQSVIVINVLFFLHLKLRSFKYVPH